MKNIYLLGHTGSMNRGCEAIVVSTNYILEKLGIPKGNRYLYTHDRKYDEFLKLNNIINLKNYPKKSVFLIGLSFLSRKIGISPIHVNKLYYKRIYNMSSNNSIAFTIGGDTYCYGTPKMLYASNDFLKAKNIPNIFYGCSINDTTIENKEMREDINKYSCIITRESYSKKTFEKVLNDKSTLKYACDPAFHLPVKKTKLPKGFLINNTVGINLSPLVFSDCSNLDDIMYTNIHNLINYILKETNMNVCLIPHVYNIENNLQDSFVLNNIYKKYIKNERVSIVNNELSCTELKYIISKCRFFIGARTHATIAAYSSKIPTLALSYSIKSRGIAKDLFGKEDGYLLKWKEIKNEDVIKNVFINSLYKNEDDIVNNYRIVLSKYRETIIVETRKILERYNYRNEE